MMLLAYMADGVADSAAEAVNGQHARLTDRVLTRPSRLDKAMLVNL
jgi:hypothetical protein